MPIDVAHFPTSDLLLRNDMADCQRADSKPRTRLLGRRPLMKAGHVVRVSSCKAKAGRGDLQTEIGAISYLHRRHSVLFSSCLSQRVGHRELRGVGGVRVLHGAKSRGLWVLVSASRSSESPSADPRLERTGRRRGAALTGSRTGHEVREGFPGRVSRKSNRLEGGTGHKCRVHSCAE